MSRPNHIVVFLVTVRDGGWFGWSTSKNKVYANLIVHDGGSKPTEQACIDGLAALQSAYDTEKAQLATDKANANSKLIALGLTQAEINALK